MEKYDMTDATNCAMLQAILSSNQNNKLFHLVRSLNKALRPRKTVIIIIDDLSNRELW